MKRHIMGIIFFLMISSCDRETTKYTDIKIGDVEIITQSNSLENSDEMREVCESFKLSKSQVITYYYESRESTESEIHDSYNILLIVAYIFAVLIIQLSERIFNIKRIFHLKKTFY